MYEYKHTLPGSLDDLCSEAKTLSSEGWELVSHSVVRDWSNKPSAIYRKKI